MLRALWHEREQQKQHIEELSKRSDDLYLENLQLQKELLRYKKATYGQRAELADRIPPRTLRALAACAQEVCMLTLRASRRTSPDRGGGESGDGDRKRLCGSGAAGLHRDQQVR